MSTFYIALIPQIKCEKLISLLGFSASAKQLRFRKCGHNLPEVQYIEYGVEEFFVEHYNVTVKLTFDHLDIKCHALTTKFLSSSPSQCLDKEFPHRVTEITLSQEWG